jgi:hypothetical protein
VGDEFKVVVLVQDVSRIAPFRSVFRIHIDEDAVGPLHPPTKLPGGASLAGFPNIREVYRDTWIIENFDQMSALNIKSSGDR